MSNTEYQVEYCHMGGTEAHSGRRGRGHGPVGCMKDEIHQPVGGKSQARARAAARSATLSAQIRLPVDKLTGNPIGSNGRLPVMDGDFVATVYSGADRGTHRVQPHWRDNRWSEPMRASSSTLYEPADRDPPNRNNFYTYRSTLVDARGTPGTPMAVPDVHKLRYMSTNYMSPDDWY